MFQPFAIGYGLNAWRYLQQVLPVQKELFAASPVQKRLTDHFKQQAPGIREANSLVMDRQMREVALTAYGLQDDINSLAFVRRILSEGTAQPDALANKLTDSRYQQMAQAFAFDRATPIIGLSADRVSSIIENFNDSAFEIALGETHPNLRLALNAKREVSRIAAKTLSDDARWFLVMGNPPLRQVFEKALGLPASFGTLDLDQQLGVFRSKSVARFGTSEISKIADPETLNNVIDQFVLRDQMKTNSFVSSANIALQLLRF